MKMFLRVDYKMIEALMGSIIKVELPDANNGWENHYCVWYCHAGAKVKTWLAGQESDSHVFDSDKSFVRVGVSYSTMSIEIAQRLSTLSVTKVFMNPNQLATTIKNPWFGYVPTVGWFPLHAFSETEEERKFREMASKVDLYFDYIENLRGWRAGKQRFDQLIKDGHALGLSREKMDQIIRSLMSK